MAAVSAGCVQICLPMGSDPDRPVGTRLAKTATQTATATTRGEIISTLSIFDFSFLSLYVRLNPCASIECGQRLAIPPLRQTGTAGARLHTRSRLPVLPLALRCGDFMTNSGRTARDGNHAVPVRCAVGMPHFKDSYSLQRRRHPLAPLRLSSGPARGPRSPPPPAPTWARARPRVSRLSGRGVGGH